MSSHHLHFWYQNKQTIRKILSGIMKYLVVYILVLGAALTVRSQPWVLIKILPMFFLKKYRTNDFSVKFKLLELTSSWILPISTILPIICKESKNSIQSTKTLWLIELMSPMNQFKIELIDLL